VPSPLAGKLFDENAQPLYAQGAAKGKRRYRYYVSRDLVRGSADRVRGGWRVAAPEMERAVVAAASNLLNDKATVLAALNESGIEVSDIRQIFELASDWSRRLELPMPLVTVLVCFDPSQSMYRPESS
jgi:hypothetical protein